MEPQASLLERTGANLLREAAAAGKESLRALKEERDFNEAILQTAGSLIIVLDSKGLVVRFNQECERVTGYSAADILGRPFYEFLIPASEREVVEREFANLKGGNFPSQFENSWVTRNGELRLIRWSNNAILDEERKVMHIIGVGLDITEQRQTERALRETQDRYEVALSGSSDGIWDWDLLEGRSYFSDRTLQMLGFAAGELPQTGNPFFELLHPEDRVKIEARIRRYLNHEEPIFQKEVRVRRKDGVWIWMLIRGAAMWDESGKAYRMAGSLTDVTERREHLRRLEESEARFEEAQTLAKLGSWQYDLETQSAAWSPNLFRILARDPSEGPLSADGLLDLFHPADAQSFAAVRRRTRETGLPYDITLRVRLRTGERWARIIGHTIRDEGGNVVRTFGSFQDVTESKLAELALKRSEEMLNESQRLAQLGSWEIDLIHERVAWSAETFVLFGRDTALGAPGYAEFVQILASESRKTVRRALRQASREGQRVDLEVKFLTRGGDIRYLRVLGQPTFEHGVTVRIHGSIQDITEEKLNAERLATQQAFLRNVIDTDPNYIFVKDWEGRFVLANRAVAAAYGTTPEELVGKSDADFNPSGEEVEAFRLIDRQVIESGTGSLVLEEKISSVEGPVWLHTVKCPIVSPETGERQVLGISVDITERVQNQRELESAREAALESSRMKSEFLANMSHEIRTPMNGVIGMADLLLDSTLDAEQRELTRTLRDSADSLLAILNDILDFSKIEAGQMSLESLPVDLADLLERVAASFALRAEEKGLYLHIAIDWSQPWSFLTDPVRLRQILTNLISNAVKFTSSGGIVVSLASVDGKPRFAVRDTGIGIPQERQDAIFGVFTQADGSVTRKYGGTGLGLAIVRHLSTLLGGSIRLDSAEGEGSCFTFDLDAPAIPPSNEGRRLAGRSILLGSVDPRVSEFARTALISLGAAIVSAPEEADLAFVDRRSSMHDLRLPKVCLLPRGTSLPDGTGEAVYEPLTRRSLGDAIARLTGGIQANTPVRAQRGKVLLVEDNPVNQRVAINLLHRLGVEVDLAQNGREAVTLTDGSAYDLVFMDVQMPEMDGLEATRQIRLRDEMRGRHVPIIAMTAHAMEGDRERCLEAGMDDYMSKPLRKEVLNERLTSWLEPHADPDPVVFDEAYIETAFGGEDAFFAEVLQAYVDSTDTLLEELRAATGAGDLPRALTVVHTLKGSSRSIGVNAFADRCEEVENAAKSGQSLQPAEGLLEEAPRMLAICRTRLESLISSGQA